MKKIIFTLGVTLISVCAVAQENNNRDAEGKVVRGPYETNRFFDNIFIQGGAGASVYLGGQNGGSFGNRIRPVFDLGVGKWMTPSTGVRLQANYSPSMRQYSSSFTSPFAVCGCDGKTLQKFDFFNIHGDFMWNLSNAIGGYKETRFYEVIPYLGVGYGRLSYGGAPSSDQITANMGVINKFRVSNTVDINLELRSTLAHGDFDRSTIGNGVDVPVAATIGATVRIGKVKNFKRVAVVAPADYSSYLNRINTLENDNSALNDKTKQLADEVESLKNRKPETITVVGESKTTASPVALFFALGKATLDKKELTNLDFYVTNSIKANPEKVFTLIGSADKATGSAAANQRLSEQRVQYVYDLLVNKYNVPESRLVKKAEGDAGNRFSDPELNRTVIIE